MNYSYLLCINSSISLLYYLSLEVVSQSIFLLFCFNYHFMYVYVSVCVYVYTYLYTNIFGVYMYFLYV